MPAGLLSSLGVLQAALFHPEVVELALGAFGLDHNFHPRHYGRH